MKMTRHTFLSALACLSLALAPVPALATVDESHDYTMEAATPFVEQGFIVREDYWNGEVKSGQKLMISHQLFKGNEYAFWLGSVNDDVELDLKVYDEKGNAIQLDTTDGRAYHRRGLIYQSQGQHNFAIEDFSTAISLSPESMAAALAGSWCGSVRRARWKPKLHPVSRN